MTPSEFLRIVHAEGIRRDAYDIDDSGDRNECYVCTSIGSAWRVFYAERGVEIKPKLFASQGDALQHLLTILRADPMMKRVPS